MAKLSLSNFKIERPSSSVSSLVLSSSSLASSSASFIAYTQESKVVIKITIKTNCLTLVDIYIS